MENIYIPTKSEIKKIVQHTEIEYTFSMVYSGTVVPGQFFEVSIPKFGECPISVSGITDETIDLTIRKVGQVTNELFKFKEGEGFFIRGPYGNGFDIENYKGKHLVIVAGGSGLAPVKGIVDQVYNNQGLISSFDLIAGFKSPEHILFKNDLDNWDSSPLNIIKTVDGAEKGYSGDVGLVTEYIPDLEINDMGNVEVVIVGPPMMMKFTVEAFIKKGVPEEKIWVSYERKMHCGLGKCGGCRMDSKYICLDGPVFNYVEAKKLFD